VGTEFGLGVGARGDPTDRRHEACPDDGTADARQDGTPADSGPAARDTVGTSATERGRVDGIDADRDAGRFRVRLFMPSWRRRTARDLLAAGDAERERIEQDLHDGAQQQLMALRVRLGLAADDFGERGEAEASAVLQGFGDDVERVIDEVRDLARGIYPALLRSNGLSAALVAACSHAAGPVAVHARGVRRCRPEVEIAVYFSCLAALHNAGKHAGPVPVSVDLSDAGDALHFRICDSGTGFDPAKTQVGAGIANMRERIAAVGGTLAIDSAPARGTRVQGTVPDPGWI
jgi:signal transduction histidine kinase